VGNAHLQPESAWSYESGADWTPNAALQLSVTGFVSPQHNSIDYTRMGPTDLYHATNLANFRYAGVETAADWHVSRNDLVRGSYTFVSGAQSALGNLESAYVFNFPVHNASVEWLAWLHALGLQARTRIGVTRRFDRDAYAVADVAVARSVGRIQPYVNVTNLANTGYEEIQGVRMQGRAFVGGVALQLSRPKAAGTSLRH